MPIIENKKHNEDQPCFFIVDDNYKNDIADKLAFGDTINFALTCSKGLTLFQNLNKYQAAVEKRRQLLRRGVLGELDVAKAMWAQDPELLHFSDTIYFPNRSYFDANGNELSQPIDIPFYINPGRPKYTNSTFYKILLRNSEFKAAAEAGEFMPLEEKQKQFFEVFLDGEITKKSYDPEKAKKLLQAFFDELVKDNVIDENDMDKMSDSTRKALYAIYDYAKLQLEDETGVIFPPEFYDEALKIYDNQCGQFGNNWGKYILWCRRIEEWLKGCLGTGYLRSLSQGPANDHITDQGCYLADGTPYFVFQRASDSIPGFHFRVDVYGWADGWRLSRLSRRPRADFSRIVSSNSESWDRLYAAICASKNPIEPSLK